MSTSGSTNFQQTRDQVVNDALMLIGRLGEGETATTNALTFCSNILNKMIKHWETQGVHLWTASEGTVFLRNAVSKYTLSTSGDHACDDSSLVETTLASDGSGTSITVSDSTGMSLLDNIGIELDDDTRQWTTITTIVGNAITLNSALTGPASSGGTVFSYTTNIGRPLKVLDARLRIDSSADLSMKMIGRVQFMRITTKTTAGFPNTGFYSPNRDNGSLYLWPVPDAVSQRLKVSYVRSIEDLDSGSDNPDLPQEWLLALTYNLARLLASAYGLDLKRKDLSDIIDIAVQALEELKAWDNDDGSVFVLPDDNS